MIRPYLKMLTDDERVQELDDGTFYLCTCLCEYECDCTCIWLQLAKQRAAAERAASERADFKQGRISTRLAGSLERAAAERAARYDAALRAFTEEHADRIIEQGASDPPIEGNRRLCALVNVLKATDSWAPRSIQTARALVRSHPSLAKLFKLGAYQSARVPHDVLRGEQGFEVTGIVPHLDKFPPYRTITLRMLPERSRPPIRPLHVRQRVTNAVLHAVIEGRQPQATWLK